MSTSASRAKSRYSNAMGLFDEFIEPDPDLDPEPVKEPRFIARCPEAQKKIEDFRAWAIAERDKQFALKQAKRLQKKGF